MSKTKNVFISHHGKDEEHLGKLTDLLGKKGLEVRNSSIDSSKPNNANNEDYIRSILKPRINWAGTTVVLIGDKTHKRDWVDWEIEQANKLGKRIVGVYIRGCSDADIPENLENYGDALVAWNGDSIVDAINGNDIWQTPNGEPRPQTSQSSGTTC